MLSTALVHLELPTFDSMQLPNIIPCTPGALLYLQDWMPRLLGPGPSKGWTGRPRGSEQMKAPGCGLGCCREPVSLRAALRPQ